MRSLVPVLALLSAAAGAATPDWDATARDMLAHAIAVPTVEGRGRVPELARWFGERFRAAGWAADDIHVLPYAPDPKNPTAALIVRWPASGKPAARPLLVMGHMDVVEAKREDWTLDPFVLTEKDGYLYGRGVQDMKGQDVALVTALLKLRAEGFRPKRDIVLLLTGDEETSGQGAELAATTWRKWTDADLALNADAGGGTFLADGTSRGFTLQSAEKSYADYTLAVRNKGGHSSRPRPDNAIYQLTHALERVEAFRFKPALNDTSRAYFQAQQAMDHGPLGDAMRAWLRNPADNKAADAIEADPLATGLTRTRCVATMLAGGHAPNALPQLATATVNCRILPGVDPAAIRDELQRAVADPGVAVTMGEALPAGEASPLRPDVVKAYTEAVHARFPQAPIVPEMSTGATDAPPFRRSGVPVYGTDGIWIVTPEDERAHGRDERVPTKAFYGDIAHWSAMLRSLAG